MTNTMDSSEPRTLFGRCRRCQMPLLKGRPCGGCAGGPGPGRPVSGRPVHLHPATEAVDPQAAEFSIAA